MVYEDKIILNVVKLWITSIFAHKMDYVCSLRIIFSNSGINGSFLTHATKILDEPSWFCASFEDNHWPVLWNYGKIKHHSAEGNCRNDCMMN